MQRLLLLIYIVVVTRSVVQIKDVIVQRGSEQILHRRLSGVVAPGITGSKPGSS